MKTTLLAISIAMPFLISSSHAQGQKEVAFSIQGDQLTWFEVDNPAVQGILAVTGLPTGFDGNALAYDNTANRLLFLSGPAATQHGLFSVSLEDVILKADEAVSAGAAVNVGILSFAGSRELFGGGFYDGSYYTLINGSDTLVKVDFDSPGGSISSSTQINLPGNPDMYLGDVAFDTMGNLWISGNTDPSVTATNDRLWRYSTTDGETFVNEGPLSPAGVRYNGIFFGLEDEDLHGYRKAGGNPAQYGSIDQDTGEFSQVYVGEPFESGGDLSNGILIEVVPEPSGAILTVLGGGLGLMRRRRR